MTFTVEFSKNLKIDSTIALLRKRLNKEFNVADEYNNFQLYHKKTGKLVIEIDEKDEVYQQAKLVDLFEPEEDNSPAYVFECVLKEASDSDHFRGTKTIELRNATKNHLKIIIEYKTKEFAKERDQRYVNLVCVFKIFTISLRSLSCRINIVPMIA